MHAPIDVLDASRDLDSCARALCLAFGGTPEYVRDWLLNKCTPSNVRVIRQGARVVATGTLIPMAQFYGGKSVPMVGEIGRAHV